MGPYALLARTDTDADKHDAPAVTSTATSTGQGLIEIGNGLLEIGDVAEKNINNVDRHERIATAATAAPVVRPPPGC